MPVPSSATVVFVLLASAAAPADAQVRSPQWTDWGGGYLRGPDSASTTVATSGGGSASAAPVPLAAAPVVFPLTDWGGGYLRGPDSASTTVANSGSGAAPPTPAGATSTPRKEPSR